MLFTFHAAAGTAIGWLMRHQSTATTTAVAAASHLLLDAIPHWGTNRRNVWLAVATADVTAGTALAAHTIAAAPQQHRQQLLAAAVAAVALDLPKIPAQVGIHTDPRWLRNLHSHIQTEIDHPAILATTAGAAVALLHLLHTTFTKATTDE